MSLSFLLSREQASHWCGSKGPLKLNGNEYWIPPQDFVDAFLPQILGDFVHEVRLSDPNAKLSHEGAFYEMSDAGQKRSKSKYRIPGAPSMPEILERLTGLGYSIPQNYWQTRGSAIADAVNRHHTSEVPIFV